MFGNLFRTFGPRILASLFGGLATYIGIKTSGAVSIDPAAAAEVVTGVLVTYSATHRATSAVVNKGDAATGRVAQAENKASDHGTTVVVPPPTK